MKRAPWTWTSLRSRSEDAGHCRPLAVATLSRRAAWARAGLRAVQHTERVTRQVDGICPRPKGAHGPDRHCHSESIGDAASYLPSAARGSVRPGVAVQLKAGYLLIDERLHLIL